MTGAGIGIALSMAPDRNRALIAARSRQEKALAVLPIDGRQLTVAEAALASNLSKGIVRKSLDELFVAEKVHRTGTGHKGQPFRYRRIGIVALADSIPFQTPSDQSNKVSVHV